jgi:4-aminobutyrate aminotransferase-like enzyme
VNDKEIIDFVAMMSTANLGQCHPKLLEATIKAAQEGK